MAKARPELCRYLSTIDWPKCDQNAAICGIAQGDVTSPAPEPTLEFEFLQTPNTDFLSSFTGTFRLDPPVLD